jgi:SAM-dependent methyltransferase
MLTAFYKWKVQFLKTPRGCAVWRHWQNFRGRPIGNYSHLPDLIRQHVDGKTFVDIGCMWGVNGDYAFHAEQCGATEVKGVDVFGPTPEFVEKKAKLGSDVEFILGDASHPAILEQIGIVDVVFCAGVLYHHPAPFDLLIALRRICRSTLILRTSTIPEMSGLPNTAVYFPMLSATDRNLWNLSSLGLLRQEGITESFNPEAGYGNWFWGLTPSCLASLLETAGFRVDRREAEPFAQTFICTAVESPFAHRLPDEEEAREMAAEISMQRIAQPA